MTGMTHPCRTSAPLPPEMQVEWPAPRLIVAEIQRAATELMWALHKQRAAWAHMERLNREYEGRGNAFFKDNERPWKLAVGDVSWWRGEVSSRSNAMIALLTLAAAIDDRPAAGPHSRLDL